ncbi:MAG: sigma 54-interacting transcriptional regulator [Deltaproteobacteria bacterium]|nr:sigma 54-interacting transcriptional regulator [Deltaproteobacteria bacterium]
MADTNENLGDFVFKCDHCGKKNPLIHFISAIALHGVIFLTGREDGYFGTVCPKCKKISLKKAEKKYIETLKGKLRQLSQADGSGEERLRYCSIPYKLDDYEGWLLKYGSPTITPLHDKSYFLELPDLHFFPPSDDSIDVSESYTTYLPGEPNIGPAMVDWSFNKEFIDDLVDLENITRQKIFPRYIFYDESFEAINNFCWENHIKFEYVKFLNEYAHPPVVIEVSENPLQKRAERNVDFLTILSTISSQPYNPLPSSFNPLALNVIQPFYGSKFQKALNDFNTEPQVNIMNGPSHEDMIEEVWKNVNKEHIQETLSTLSNRFILEYIELARKIDFSCGTAWKLKESYLNELYDSVKSKHKRKIITNRVPEVELREVREAENRFPGVKIISRDSKINAIKIELSQLAQIEKMDIDFLLLGETGTGKELFANAIHESSGRKGQFVPVNCASIPEELFESEFFGHKKGAFTGATEDKKGYFEQANRGTLFLDEIGELSPKFQPRLLRAIQEKEIQPVGATQRIRVDVKMVFGTNRELYEMVEKGEFREDLYQRIKGFTFLIPPLRKRKNDILPLVEHFIEKFDIKRKSNLDLTPIKASDECIDVLKKCEWKGNVRELENVIKKIIAYRLVDNNREVIRSSDLPKEILNGYPSTKSSLKPKDRNNLPGSMKVTDEEIRDCMKKHNGNKSKVAEELGVTYKTILRHWKKLNP